MILLLDVGNTRIKWVALEGGGSAAQGGFTHRDADLAPLLDEAWSGISAPARVIVSSVAGTEKNETLAEWMTRKWRAPIRFVATQAEQFGVRCGYREPARLGVDRWVVLLAARARFSTPVCVVDFGSALTIDGVSGSGEHLGGMMVPGLRTMHRSLTAGDVTLDASVEIEIPREVTMGRDTAEAVGYGIQYCLALFVDGVCDSLERTMGGRSQRIVTGGDAERMLPLLNNAYRHLPDLVLEGLALIAREDEE